MNQTSKSAISIISTTVGGAIAGPVGAAVGSLVGDFFPKILPALPEVIGGALTNVASDQLVEIGNNLYSHLNPEEKQYVNHDLQTAFRDAFQEALYDIGGKDCFPKAWREKRKGVPDAIIYAKTAEGTHLWRSNSPLAEQICGCLNGMVEDLKKDILLPLNPPQEQSMASVDTYLAADTPGTLNGAFFTQVVSPYLTKHGSLIREVPDFESHLRRHLLDRTLIYLGELFKERTPAWRAFNRMLLEGVRQQVDAVSEGQNEITEKLDQLLTGTDTESLASFSEDMATLLAATGRMEKALDAKLDTVLDQVVQQHSEVIQSLDSIEGKVDRVLRILEDGNFVIEGPAPVALDEPPAPGEAPFKGMRHYDVEDADCFFGRETLTAQLVARLKDERFLAVVGASGSGKSSIVRAGVVPALQNGGLPGSADWQIHLFTPTNQPLEALAASLTRDEESLTAASTLAKDLAQDAHSLSLFARKQIATGQTKHLLLVVDQFEELFTACKQEELRKTFIASLLDAAQSDLVTILIVLRADFYSHCARYPGLPTMLENHQAYIEAMSREELQRAIEKPAEMGGWHFERGLVKVILDDVEGEPGALPLLSHALLETWQHRRGRQMTLESYVESGGVRTAIAKTAETVYRQQLDEEQQAIARSIFLRLTELGEGVQDTRRRASLDELVTRAEDITRVQQVLQTLTDARLITTKKNSAEVAHEALIREWPSLRDWLEEDREGLRLHRHLTEAAGDWLARGKDPADLYRGTRLAQVEEWNKENGTQLNPQEREFLEESLAARTREENAARRRRRLLAAAGVVLIAVFAVATALFQGQARENEALAETAQAASTQAISQQETAVFALAVAETAQEEEETQRQEANLQRDEAETQLAIAVSRELVNKALSVFKTNYELGLLLGIESYKKNENLETRNALYNLIIYRPQKYHFYKDHLMDIEPGNVSNKLAAVDLSGNVIIWDTTTFSTITEFEGFGCSGSPHFEDSLLFSPNDKMVLSGCLNRIKIRQLESDYQITNELIVPGDILDFKLSPDSKQLIVLLQEPNLKDLGKIYIYNFEDILNEITEIPIFSVREPVFSTSAFDVSQQGKLAYSDYDSIIRIINLNSLTEENSIVINDLNLPDYFQTNEIRSLMFNPEGTKLLIGIGYSSERALIVNVETNQIMAGNLNGDYEWSKTGRFLSRAYTFNPNIIELFNSEPYELLYEYEFQYLNYFNSLIEVDFSHDDKSLFIVTVDDQIHVLDIQGDQNIAKRLVIPESSCVGDSEIEFLPNRRVFISGCILHTESGEALFTPPNEAPFNDELTELYDWEINSAHTSIAAGDWQNTYLLDIITGHVDILPIPTEFHELEIHPVFTNTFSPDNHWLVSGTWQGSEQPGYLLFWDLATRELKHTIASVDEFDPDIWEAKFSPDGEILASLGDDITLWDVDKLETITKISVGDPIEAFDFSSDGNRMVFGTTYPGSVYLWDISKNQASHVFTGLSSFVWTLDINKDESLIAAIGDGILSIWEIEGEKQILRIEDESISGPVEFSDDGKTLLFGDSQGLRMLDLTNWVEKACVSASRNLTQEEWVEYFPGEPYRQTCEQWPAGE